MGSEARRVRVRDRYAAARHPEACAQYQDHPFDLDPRILVHVWDGKLAEGGLSGLLTAFDAVGLMPGPSFRAPGRR